MDTFKIKDILKASTLYGDDRWDAGDDDREHGCKIAGSETLSTEDFYKRKRLFYLQFSRAATVRERNLSKCNKNYVSKRPTLYHQNCHALGEYHRPKES